MVDRWDARMAVRKVARKAFPRAAMMGVCSAGLLVVSLVAKMADSMVATMVVQTVGCLVAY